MNMLEPVNCACVSWDAIECVRIRCRIDIEDDPGEPCECACHDPDDEEDDDATL